MKNTRKKNSEGSKEDDEGSQRNTFRIERAPKNNRNQNQRVTRSFSCDQDELAGELGYNFEFMFLNVFDTNLDNNRNHRIDTRYKEFILLKAMTLLLLI